MSDENKTLLEAGRALGTVIKEHGGVPLVVLPQGYSVHGLENLLPNPSRAHTTAKFVSVDSFCEYINVFKTRFTRIFAKVGTSAVSVEAIIDYHGPETPQWLSHRAKLDLVPTVEWSDWIKHNSERMDQIAFAAFLEERDRLFQAPPGAELLELVSTLEGKSDVRFESGIRLQNGKSKLNYEEDVTLRGAVGTQRGAMEIPDTLILGIAPFEFFPAYEVKARLRYRIEGRKLSFWYETMQPHRIIKDVADKAIDMVEQATSLTVFFGGI